ncbi:MAG: pyruvate kinase [Acidobacteriota bacterium]
MGRKTKIIATIGPASDSVQTLARMIAEGLDVVRLNFSHGTHESHANTIARVHEARRVTGYHIPILQDLQGPRIRIGKLPGDQVELVEGKGIILSTRKDRAPAGSIPTDYEALARDVRQGDHILINDGLLELEVKSTDGLDAQCVVVRGGLVRSHKGINLPGVNVTAEALTQKDLDDLSFGIEHGVDLVALSFVRSASDVLRLKQEIASRGGDAWVVAKIERKEAIDEIDEIVRESDAVMVARGDLGVELPGERVPILQKMIIATCNSRSTPVITATQMLESMVSSQRPTRAELTDVANAVIDGTDMVMLSAETGVGQYPVETVAMMDKIIGEAESLGIQRHPPVLAPAGLEDHVLMAIAHAACVLSQQVDARAIVPFTHSGKTAQSIGSYRPAAQILAATSSLRTAQKLNALWGTHGLFVEPSDDTDGTVLRVEQELLRLGLIHRGDRMVVTAGVPLFVKATTNMVRVHTVEGPKA